MISGQSHPTMMLFVFFYSLCRLRLSMAWIQRFCPRTLSHIEHEKCLVRLSGSLDFLFVAFLIFWQSYSHALLLCFSPLDHIHGMLAFSSSLVIPPYLSDVTGRITYLPSCFRWLLSVSVLSSLLLEVSCLVGWRTRPHPYFFGAAFWPWLI